MSLSKVESKKEKLENFKTAISSTVRSISNSQKIEISFGNNISKSEKNLIELPALQQISDKINYDEIRAIADSKSLRYRFSNKEILNFGGVVKILKTWKRISI